MSGTLVLVYTSGLMFVLRFFAGFCLIGEWREGVIEAERVTPANRTALLVGRLMRDVAQLFVQAVILVVLGYAMGMRAPVSGVELSMALL